MTNALQYTSVRLERRRTRTQPHALRRVPLLPPHHHYLARPTSLPAARPPLSLPPTHPPPASHPPQRRCTVQCYESVLICSFRSAFDAYKPAGAPPCARAREGGAPGPCVPAPWRAAQRVASLIAGADEPGASSRSRSTTITTTTRGSGSGGNGGGCVAAAAAAHQRVLRLVFVNRTQTTRSRGLANLDELLGRCAALRGGLLPQHRVAHHRTSPISPRGLRLCCSAHAFGGGSLAQDIRVARSADMLVGTHGAGLNNAFFMRRGGALLELRPHMPHGRTRRPGSGRASHLQLEAPSRLRACARPPAGLQGRAWAAWAPQCRTGASPRPPNQRGCRCGLATPGTILTYPGTTSRAAGPTSICASSPAWSAPCTTGRP